MDELDAIRAKRLAELQGASSSNGSPNIPGLPQQSGSAAQQQQQQASQREEEEESRRQIIGQILDAQARERLNRIALVRPERSRAISELLIRMARSGQLRGKVTEQQLLGVLEQVEANERGGSDKSGKISFQRRKATSDDSDDDDVSFKPMSTSTARRKKDSGEDDDDDDFDL